MKAATIKKNVFLSPSCALFFPFFSAFFSCLALFFFYNFPLFSFFLALNYSLRLRMVSSHSSFFCPSIAHVRRKAIKAATIERNFEGFISFCLQKKNWEGACDLKTKRKMLFKYVIHACYPPRRKDTCVFV